MTVIHGPSFLQPKATQAVRAVTQDQPLSVFYLHSINDFQYSEVVMGLYTHTLTFAPNLFYDPIPFTPNFPPIPTLQQSLPEGSQETLEG